MGNTVILSVHTNLIEVGPEKQCENCLLKRSEFFLSKFLCSDCFYKALGILSKIETPKQTALDLN